MATAANVAFVSGPISPPPTYFAEHYQDRLLEAIASDSSFVLGPAPGIDTLTLKFLVEHGVNPARITVYLAGFEDRTLRPGLGWFEQIGGRIHVEGVTTSDRDAAMTRDSNYDILRCMSIQEQKVHYGENYYPRVSATQKNERRRQGLPLHYLDPDSAPSVSSLKPAGNVSSSNRTTVASHGIKRFFDRICKTSRPSNRRQDRCR